jgi:hypothetical protein
MQTSCGGIASTKFLVAIGAKPGAKQLRVIGRATRLRIDPTGMIFKREDPPTLSYGLAPETTSALDDSETAAAVARSVSQPSAIALAIALH